MEGKEFDSLVKDMSLAAWGRKEIELAQVEMPGKIPQTHSATLLSPNCSILFLPETNPRLFYIRPYGLPYRVWWREEGAQGRQDLRLIAHDHPDCCAD